MLVVDGVGVVVVVEGKYGECVEMFVDGVVEG